MNDSWAKRDGTRWNQAERDAVSRLFRSYVRTAKKPRAPIHREACHFHPEVEGEAHHPDYSKPFLVAWLGGKLCGCHRKADHGSLKVTKRMLWDYTSLVATRAKPGNRGARNGMSAKRRTDTGFETVDVSKPVPF